MASGIKNIELFDRNNYVLENLGIRSPTPIQVLARVSGKDGKTLGEVSIVLIDVIRPLYLECRMNSPMVSDPVRVANVQEAVEFVVNRLGGLIGESPSNS